MVLRELLLSYKFIAERQVYVKQRFQPPSDVSSRNAKGQFLVKSATMASGHRLTPAILSACQLLLREGWPILYEENTLAIHVYSGFVGLAYFMYHAHIHLCARRQMYI